MEKTLPFRLPERLKRDLERTCTADDQAVSQVLRQLIRSHVEARFDARCASVSLNLQHTGGGLATDLRTGGTLCTNEPDDIKTFKRTYWLMDAFERLHPEVAILPYAAREDLKREGHAMLARGRQTRDVVAQVEGYEQVMRAHYCRSVENALDTSSPFSYLEHPGYDEFAKHYVACDAAMPNRQPDLVRALQARWPAPVGQICVQGSYWRRKEPA